MQSAQYGNLFEAIINDDLIYFRTLLEYVTWPRTTDYLDLELLTTALEFGRKSIAMYLLDRKCRVNQPASDIHPIHLALTNPVLCDVVKRLLALGASVSATNSSGDNAIHVAFANEAPGRTIDMLLLSYMGETRENKRNADGLSVFHVVCTRSNLFIMKKLVESKSKEDFVQNDLNCQVNLQCDRNYAGYTPLHFAVSHGHKEITKYLVMNFNVDAYIQDINGSTPLHLALERRDIHAIDLIMAYNFPKIAYRDVVNSSGMSHFMVACAASIQDFAKKFMQIADMRSSEILSSLVNRQVYNNNVADDRRSSYYVGYAPMHFAAKFGRANTVQQLIHFGASFFVKTSDNCSPLVVALKHGHGDITRLIFWCYKQYRKTISATDSSVDGSEIPKY